MDEPFSVKLRASALAGLLLYDPFGSGRSSVKRVRRFVALLALLAVGWTSLWPLVCAAHAKAASLPMPLCHRMSGMVPADEAPQGPMAPGDPKQHCPLCVMAFYAGFAQPPQVPCSTFSVVVVLRDVHYTQHLHDVEVALPFGRAPPHSILV